MVSSERLIQGLIRVYNDWTLAKSDESKSAWAALLDIDRDRESYQFFVNCKNESIATILGNEQVGRRGYKLSVAQNLFEIAHPTEYQGLSFEYFIKNLKETRPDTPELKILENVKLGTIQPIMDKEILKKLDLSGVQTPDFVKTIVRLNDSLNIQLLDRIEWA